MERLCGIAAKNISYDGMIDALSTALKGFANCPRLIFEAIPFLTSRRRFVY